MHAGPQISSGLHGYMRIHGGFAEYLTGLLVIQTRIFLFRGLNHDKIYNPDAISYYKLKTKFLLVKIATAALEYLTRQAEGR